MPDKAADERDAISKLVDEVRRPGQVIASMSIEQLWPLLMELIERRQNDTHEIIRGVALRYKERMEKAEADLAAMTEDRNLWQDQHNEDCPNLANYQTLLDDAVDMRNQLAAAKAGGWIDCKQELPPDRKAVLVWCPERMNKYTACWIDGSWSYFGGGCDYRILEEVSHWMPTPTPPDTKGEEK